MVIEPLFHIGDQMVIERAYDENSPPAEQPSQPAEHLIKQGTELKRMD